MYIDSDSHPHPQAVEKRFGDALANNDFYYNQCPESHFRHSHINLTGSIRGTPMMLGSRAAAQNTLSRTATISRRPFPHQTNYVRFSHAHTPPRAPSNLHFFSWLHFLSSSFLPNPDIVTIYKGRNVLK